MGKNVSEKTICNLEILKESGQFMGDDEVEIRYTDLEENCIVETTRKWYTTKLGRYVNIKGRRYYIDNKYRYCIDKKGDDFDFSNLRVTYYDYEDACLTLKPINNLKLKDFKSSMYRNQLKNHIDWADRNEIWEDDVNEIQYNIWLKEIRIPLIDWCEIITLGTITQKDKEIFEILKEKYFKDNDIEDSGCRCEYRDGFVICNEDDWDEYHDWALSVGLE